MGPFVAAWLVGEGIIIYRSVKVRKAPPSPGALLFSSGLFVALGLLAEAESARKLAVTLAWGFDIAAFMNLWGVGGPSTGKHGTPSSANELAAGNWPPPDAGDDVVFPGTGKPVQKTDSNPNTAKPLKNV